jgi:hypothetical protein
VNGSPVEEQPSIWAVMNTAAEGRCSVGGGGAVCIPQAWEAHNMAPLQRGRKNVEVCTPQCDFGKHQPKAVDAKSACDACAEIFGVVVDMYGANTSCGDGQGGDVHAIHAMRYLQLCFVMVIVCCHKAGQVRGTDIGQATGDWR